MLETAAVSVSNGRKGEEPASTRSNGRWWLSLHPATFPVMKSMHALEGEPWQNTTLLQQLYQLYTAERQLALDLSGLFHRSISIPERLELSERRKDATRHILRLERVIQLTTGTPASHVVAGMTTLRPSPSEPGESSDIPLRALRAAVVGYGAAISTATRLGRATIADLLAETLSEKRDAIIALSPR